MSRTPPGPAPSPSSAPPSSPQLSLFDEAPAAAAPASPSRTPVPAPPAPAAPAPNVLTPAVFRHPQAERELRLGDHVVAYAFRRARRRSIGFTVSTEGLAVSAPRWVPLSEVDAALQAKASWILRKLQEQRSRAQRLASSRIEWRDGTSLPFLGETVILVLDPRATGAMLNTDGQALPGVPRLTLHVGLPQNAAPEQIRDVVQSWLQRQARRVFEERCQHFAHKLSVRMRRLSLSSAQTRWGSASADGSIRLHWRLIHFAMPIIDYVVAHELAHLREMNHSPAFWDVVRSVLPDYEQHRGALKDDVLPAFD
ncbi:M48 family metallopeptidase [Ideonella sp. BN130291]|uniref:M48 family metallopeptidase n=1 Tax=Ideonella sp. BN130291 TaxID=3112940 RepID=UPI002E268054|nr:SprT family zinc-dependent metalloprotease [Ideonella sp. BN130291]